MSNSSPILHIKTLEEKKAIRILGFLLVPYPNTQNEIKHFLRTNGMKLYVYWEYGEKFDRYWENGELAIFYSIDTIDEHRI